MGWNDRATDYRMWARTQQHDTPRKRSITAFRNAVERMHRKQLEGQVLSVSDYVELSILANRMYSPGDYCAFPAEVRAALQIMIDNCHHMVSSG